MKVLVAVAFLFVAASAVEKRQFGICVEECSMSASASSSKLLRSLSIDGQCPDGQACMSNGCGHTCQPDPNAKKCSGVFCFMYCANGYELDANGCETCHCKPTPTKCPGVMCAMFCTAGFETGSDGCPICKCKDENSIQ